MNLEKALKINDTDFCILKTLASSEHNFVSSKELKFETVKHLRFYTGKTSINKGYFYVRINELVDLKLIIRKSGKPAFYCLNESKKKDINHYIAAVLDFVDEKVQPLIITGDQL